LTNTLQRNASQSTKTPLWQRSDNRFFWNRYLQSSLINFRNQSDANAEVDAYILPIIFGFLHVQHTFANHKALTVALISRRSRFRVGTRFFSRGVDANGNVSNFNETEQMLLIPSTAGQKWMSYVQTRGSIPVYWAEVMDLKYKPKLRIFGQIDKSVVSFGFKADDRLNLRGNILSNKLKYMEIIYL
jgi:phosphatidylinositol 4-phosphatase